MPIDFVDKSGEPPSIEDAEEALHEWDKAMVGRELIRIPSLMVQCTTIRAVLKLYIALMRSNKKG